MSGTLTLDPAAVAPDHVAAIIARLRRFDAVLALCPDETAGGRTVKRVAGRLAAVPDGWTGHAAIVQEAGGFGPDPDAPLDRPRVDVLCHASTGHEAATLARTVIAALVPLGRVGSGFTEAGCHLRDVRRVSGLVPFFDRENRTHVRAVTFELLKDETPR